MHTLPPFSGLPPAGMQFLADLAAHNDRAWFEAHKDEYETALLEPAQSFIVALGTRLQVLAPGINCDTRTDGRGVLVRIHRDTRFSADKSPYKTRISGLFREGQQKKMESPAFGFQFDAAGMELITGIFKFPPPALAAYRSLVADERAGAALLDVLKTVNRAGDYKVEGKRFKRVPAGYDPNYKYADLLRYEGLHAISPLIPPSDIHTGSLVDVCYGHYRNMAPIYDWLKHAL